jgi:hypothetical protein
MEFYFAGNSWPVKKLAETTKARRVLISYHYTNERPKFYHEEGVDYVKSYNRDKQKKEAGR